MSSQLVKLTSLRRTGKNDSECARSRTAWPLLAVELKAGSRSWPGIEQTLQAVGLVENNREQTLQSRPWVIREA
jgi:hypothetical protein